MARQRRISEPGAYHHITARGVDRCAVFLDDHDRRSFLSLVAEAKSRFGCTVLAFCLMDNHIHLTIRDDQGTLSKTLHLLNGAYAKRFNLRHERTGHLFERRFWSPMLDSDSYLTMCVRYVHMNPVEAGMVRHPAEYRWSSYSSYLGVRQPPGFLDTQIVLAHYGNDIEQFRTQTEQSAPPSLVLDQLRSPNPPGILGPEDATSERSLRMLSVDAPPTVGIDDVIAVCAVVTDVPEAGIRTKSQGRRSPARQLASYIAHRHAGIPLREIAEALDHSSPAAVSVANRRFEQVADRPDIAALMDRAIQALGLRARSAL